MKLSVIIINTLLAIAATGCNHGSIRFAPPDLSAFDVPPLNISEEQVPTPPRITFAVEPARSEYIRYYQYGYLLAANEPDFISAMTTDIYIPESTEAKMQGFNDGRDAACRVRESRGKEANEPIDATE